MYNLRTNRMISTFYIVPTPVETNTTLNIVKSVLVIKSTYESPDLIKPIL